MRLCSSAGHFDNQAILGTYNCGVPAVRLCAMDAALGSLWLAHAAEHSNAGVRGHCKESVVHVPIRTPISSNALACHAVWVSLLVDRRGPDGEEVVRYNSGCGVAILSNTNVINLLLYLTSVACPLSCAGHACYAWGCCVIT